MTTFNSTTTNPLLRRNPYGTRLAFHESKALLRMKKESPGLRADFEQNKYHEVNYDLAPTKIYKLIEAKKWNAAIERCNSHPYEAKTWVYRSQGGGKVRWKLLPIHIAIIFRAPCH